MKKLFFLISITFYSLLFASTASAQCQGNVYFTSFTWQTINSVHGYSSTYLDYCGGLYYDPALFSNFKEIGQNGFALIGEGYTQGYADSYPAEISFDFPSPLNTGVYATSGDHYVIAYYLVYVPYWNSYGWYDPWSFGFEGVGNNEVYYDYGGYWGYEAYWTSSPQYIDSTSHTITYQGVTQCQPGQQFTPTGQPCPNANECQNNQQFTSTGQVCLNYVPPVVPPQPPIVSVHVFGQPLYPAGLPAVLSTPVATKNTLAATCITGVPDAGGRAVTLQIVNNSLNSGFDGGHTESLHSAGRPLGKLGKTNGVTGADGCFRTTYTPPHISGQFKLKATISGIPSETDIGVAVSGLVRLFPGENYRLNGGIIDCNVPDDSCSPTIGRQAHPSNHWVVPGAKAALIKTADDYKTRFYGNGSIPVADMITYNDASLEWGGKFDLFRNWSTENKNHGEHREGLSIDTRSNNLHGRDNDFIEIFFANGFGFNDERRKKDGSPSDAPHFHLRWADLRFTGIPGLLQNGIDQNAFAYDPITESPSTLLDNVCWSIFERETTQAEFEAWLPQLSNAKTQGQNVFLQEVKTFEKQMFASQEYITRQRTNEQFVQDVFASHLFREPTLAELSYWMDYLADIGGTQPIDPVDTESGRGRTTIPINQMQRRQIFLNDFEALPAFVNRVASVVDDTYQEPPH